jgi:cell division protein FtsI (penicillin-binding protein 3)
MNLIYRVCFAAEYRRYYPASEYTAHLIGFTDIDDHGQEGLELAFDEELAGKPGSRRVIKDRLGHIIEDVGSIRIPQQGRDLTLSIDAKIQYLAYRELKHAVDANRAKAGGIVVLDAKTGEVLAMANLPSYNPNNRGKFEPGRTRNRAVTDLFEPGSTLKPFTAAVAIETGLFKFDSMIQTGTGQLSIGSATIHDAHPSGALTVAQVIQKSSNVGAAKIALALPSEKMWNMFNQVGFGTPRSGSRRGTRQARAYASWRPIEQATMACRPRHFAEPAAARARLHGVCERWRNQSSDTHEARRSGRRHARDHARDRAAGAQNARARGAARRYRAARAGDGLSRRGQDRHRA